MPLGGLSLSWLPWSSTTEGLKTDVHWAEPTLEPLPLVPKNGFSPPGSFFTILGGEQGPALSAVLEGRGVWLAKLGPSASGSAAPYLSSPWGFQLGTSPGQ